MGHSDKTDDFGREKGGEKMEKKVKYPYGVFFIVGNEFCERYSYYGMKSILSLYLKKKLKFDEDKATTIYHTFSSFCYFTPILGAWIADQFLGKFKTIVYISLFYILGHLLKTVAAIPNLGLDPYSMTFIGLALIAIGTGGIKPCVSAFGGDQFQLPEQERQLQTFFSVFYFSINAGSFISTIVTPILREDVHCFGDNTCYSLAFGVPAALMAIALVIIVLGKPLYKMNPPEGNIMFNVIGCISYGIVRTIKGDKGKEHWMDVSKVKYGSELVEDVKCLLRVLVIFLPVPVWWALFDQTGSRWTFQATRMVGDLGAAGTMKPDQMQVINPILILILLPVFDKIIYPLCAKCNLFKKPLQRMVFGGVLCSASFVIAGVLELELQKTYEKVPSEGFSNIHLMNNLPCPVSVKMINSSSTLFDEEVSGLDNLIVYDLESGSYDLEMSVDDECLPSLITQRTNKVSLALESRNVSAVVLSVEDGSVSPRVLEDVDQPQKDGDANGKVRIIYDLGELAQPGFNILYDLNKTLEFNLTDSNLSSTDYVPVEIGSIQYQILDQSLSLLNAEEEFLIEQGGVYNMLVSRDLETNKMRVNMFTLTTPNSIHILWQFPQYFVITASEVMFSVTGLEFSYSQAPASMKSVLQAAWLLTVAFGNIIVIIVAEAKAFEEQASEFFMFAGLMLVDTLIFIWLAWRFVPRKVEEDTVSDDIQMKNGLSNTNFRNDADF